jgi:hypothetical protein
VATKCLSANQCLPLHQLYGPDNCCLCAARAEMDRMKAEMPSEVYLVWELWCGCVDVRKAFTTERDAMAYALTVTSDDFAAYAEAIPLDECEEVGEVKVYLVSGDEGFAEDVHVQAVFSTREKREAYIKDRQEKSPDRIFRDITEEHEVDLHEVKP